MTVEKMHYRLNIDIAASALSPPSDPYVAVVEREIIILCSTSLAVAYVNPYLLNQNLP